MILKLKMIKKERFFRELIVNFKEITSYNSFLNSDIIFMEF